MESKKYSSEEFISRKLVDLSSTGGDIRKIFMIGQELQRRDPSKSLIDLSLGNPDLEPPAALQENLISLLVNKEIGAHRYMDSAGLVEVRRFLAQELSHSEQIKISENSIYLTVGAAGGLQILLRTFLDEGDEVIVFAPYFPEYISYVKNLNGVPIVVSCNENHQPIISEFEKSLTSKTKAIIINSPNNPTGVIYQQEVLEEMIQILNDRRNKTGQIIQIIADEPYARVAYEGKKIPKLLQMYDFCWVVRSFSKDLALAGERIGFIVWREDHSQLFSSIKDHFRSASRILGFVNAPRLMQRLLPLVFHYQVDVSIYKKRVDQFLSILKDSGISCEPPEAGFFVFPKSPISDDRKFCKMLINSGVLCVPGSGFGCPGYFRASLVHNQDLIEEAAKRIVDFKNQIISTS